MSLQYIKNNRHRKDQRNPYARYGIALNFRFTKYLISLQYTKTADTEKISEALIQGKMHRKS